MRPTHLAAVAFLFLFAAIARADVRDESLRASVEHALRTDPITDEYEVTVSVIGGTARLEGYVRSWHEKLHAARVAGHVAGIRDVDNLLGVRPPAVRDNRLLTTDVKQRVRFDTTLDDSRINVSADAGRVTLSGSVHSVIDRAAAISHAYAAGARIVEAAGLRVQDLEATDERGGHWR